MQVQRKLNTHERGFRAGLLRKSEFIFAGVPNEMASVFRCVSQSREEPSINTCLDQSRWAAVGFVA